MAYCGDECAKTTRVIAGAEYSNRCENTAVEKIRSVPEQLYSLEDRINTLTDLVEELTNRLYPVLSSPCPTECATKDMNIENIPPVAEQLKGLSSRINRQNYIIRDLLERLEI